MGAIGSDKAGQNYRASLFEISNKLLWAGATCKESTNRVIVEVR